MKFFVAVSCLLAVASCGYVAPYGHYAHHVPVIGPHGVPLEPAANVAARAAHAAAHAEAASRAGHGAWAGHGHADWAGHDAWAPAHYAHAHAYPALAHDGQVLETPEVVAAKSAHFAAHAEARARAGAHAYAAPYAHAAHYAHAVPHHSWAVPHGAPVDTPEVAAAKASHFAAHAAAAAAAAHDPHHW